jgi:DNA primase catalytic subunit
MDLTQMLNKIDIPIPDIVYSYDDEKKKEIFEYLSQIKKNEQQLKAYKIAFTHLGSSFNIYKSNGFKEWKNNRTK